MRITESQLRKVIRSVIKESLSLDADLYDRRTGERLAPMKQHDLDAMDRRIAARGPDPFAGGVTFDGKEFHHGGNTYLNFDDLGEFAGVSEDEACEAIESYCQSQGLSDEECADMCDIYVWSF